jgi:hypothetical protein
MRNEEWIALFRRIPPEQHSTLVLMCQSGNELTMESIFRTEPTYLVMRGRITGTADEGRLFFIPYSQLTFLRIERVVAESEIPAILGDPPVESAPADEALDPAAALAEVPAPPANTPVTIPTGITTADDPSAVAKNNLLAKIRAARASVSTATPPK